MTGIEKAYFPVKHMSVEIPDEDRKEEIKAFNDLRKLLSNDGHFHISEETGVKDKVKDALAFLVSAIRQLFGRTEWKREIEEIKQKISTIRANVKDPQEAEKRISWFLHHTIANLYEKSLMMNSLYAKKQHDDKMQLFYQRCFNQLKDVSLLKDALEQRGEVVSIGGIHSGMLPSWHKDL